MHPKETYTPIFFFLIKKSYSIRKKKMKEIVGLWFPTASEIAISVNEVPKMIN